ncbi:TauD/TfdA family dioxygenase [Neobacillus massiliamazoniensis]|uniref:Taurine catabolism dioxygenase TauD, TfdA family n=1 Tax=Neobacillus massiliamazoniensis TaxID=1499688 RepID=A0A0U1NY65_9BACI|nr:TauD/TfdA family dioxygenase [Neobacillus massiliamazoniensis]CRK82961.1 Taurine catabolism dioxygenase TauD, TfdA family [Neobacillus massiliamazoniensis]
MSSILKEKVQGRSAWKGTELAKDDSWIYYLSEETLAVLEKAVLHVQQKGLKAPDFKKEDFPISGLADEIAYFVDELENGRGFLLIRGLPMDRYTDEEAAIIYWGLGLHLGLPIIQSKKGDLLGHIKNVGKDFNDNTKVRGYQTNVHLDYHTDLADVVGLLCLRKAKSGGLSSIASAMAIYNEILEKHPEYLDILFRPFDHDLRGEEGAGRSPVVPSPIFSYYDGKLSCRYMRQYVESAQTKTGISLSKEEIEAFDFIDSLTHIENFHIDMMMEPGDMQFVNNYSVFHSRTHFEDYEEEHKKRHLLRLWLMMPNGRKIAPDFEFYIGGVPVK